LCVKSKLHSFQGQREPGIEQGPPIVEDRGTGRLIAWVFCQEASSVRNAAERSSDQSLRPSGVY
jgi:hypothetical protein